MSLKVTFENGSFEPKVIMKLHEIAQQSDWLTAKKIALEIQQALDERGFKDVKILKATLNMDDKPTVGHEPTVGYAVTFGARNDKAAFHVSAQGEDEPEEDRTGVVCFFVYIPDDNYPDLIVDGQKYTYSMHFQTFKIDEIEQCIADFELKP